MTHFLLKVAKKLEKLENRENRNVDSDEEDDFDCDQGDYPSIDSFRWDVFRISFDIARRQSNAILQIWT